METGYLYFVSYSHNKGFGNCYITMETPIVDVDDVTLLGEHSRRVNVKNNIKELVVMNFVLLKEYEYEKEVDSSD